MWLRVFAIQKAYMFAMPLFFRFFSQLNPFLNWLNSNRTHFVSKWVEWNEVNLSFFTLWLYIHLLLFIEIFIWNQSQSYGLSTSAIFLLCVLCSLNIEVVMTKKNTDFSLGPFLYTIIYVVVVVLIHSNKNARQTFILTFFLCSANNLINSSSLRCLLDNSTQLLGKMKTTKTNDTNCGIAFNLLHSMSLFMFLCTGFVFSMFVYQKS